MSTRLEDVTVLMGLAPPRLFTRSGSPGAWQAFDRIAFTPPFTAPPRVIVTPTNSGLPTGAPHAAVVGVVRNVQADGFELRARSSDYVDGFTGFNWLAVDEAASDPRHPIELRMGVVQPTHFLSRDETGGKEWAWNGGWQPRFSSPIGPTDPVVLVTASNLDIHAATYTAVTVTTTGEIPATPLGPGWPSYTILGPEHAVTVDAYRRVAAVGMVRDAQPTGFHLAARNATVDAGACAFYWAAVADRVSVPSSVSPPPSPTSVENPWVDSGWVGARPFQPDLVPGDWQRWDVYFSRPFLTPPILLVTATDRREDGSLVPAETVAAAVGVAENVTTHGFTILARNSGDTGGEAGFTWVALGCALGCG